MTWWRLVLKRISQPAVDKALAALRAEYIEAITKVAVEHAFALELAKRQAHAEGQLAGRQEVFDHFQGIVAERMGGACDIVSAEDIERAKKGLLH